MADFAVSTAFNARDNVSRRFGLMGRSARTFGNTADRAFKKASRSGSMFGAVLKGGLASAAIQGAIRFLQRGIRAVTTEFIDFDAALTGASAKFSDLDLATDEGRAKLQALGETAREVGSLTQFSAGEAAQGLDFLAMAGFRADQSMAALPGVVDLATVANVDLARATDIASDSLGAFNLMTDDATQLQINFTRQNDVMARTMTRTNTSMEDLFEAVKKGAPAFTAAGQSLETFNAFAGAMANSGVKGAESGTALRNVMLKLANPTAEAANLMRSLGVTTQDSDGNFRDAIDILGDFETGLDGMGSAQRTAALATIFGARTVTGITLLLQEGTDNLRAFRGELENSGGAAAEMAAIMRQSLQNRMAALKSSAIELGFKFIDTFGTKLGQGLDGVIAMTRGLNDFIGANQGIISQGLDIAFETLKGVFEDLKPTLMIVFDVIRSIGEFMVTSGIFDVAVAVFERLRATLRFMGAALGFVWKILKPVVEWLGRVLRPIFDLIKKIIELKTGFLETVTGGLQAFNATTSEGRQEARTGRQEERQERRQAANAAEVAARQRAISFTGQLNIAGAPLGSTISSRTTGAPPINMAFLGANP